MTLARRQPDLVGPAGEAWRLTFQSDHPGLANLLATWLVRLPKGHPFWQWWTVSMMALRPVEGWIPEKQYAGAVYELCVLTVDRGRCPEPDPDTPEPPPYLEPNDICVQFHGVDDRGASLIGLRCVEAVLMGTLVPDEEFAAEWRRALGILLRRAHGVPTAN